MGRKPLLTDEKVLAAIERWQVEHDDAPSIDELRRVMNVGSTRTVFRYLESLSAAGRIERSPELRVLRSRSTGVQTRSVPLVGTVAAGTPALAEENIESWIRLPKSLASPPSDHFFLLHVRGNSMDRASIDGERIESGDLALVRRRPTANSGDIVVALIDGEATVKRFSKGPGYYVLRPESTEDRHKPIVLNRDFKVLWNCHQGVQEGSRLDRGNGLIMGKNIHVTHRKDGDWAVKGQGDSRASGLFDTQRDAIDAGRTIAQNNHSELVIHDRHNVIRDKDSFGNDPCPPRDKKH